MRSGTESPAPSIAEGIWLQPADDSVSIADHRASLRQRPVASSADLRAREFQHISSQSGLQYSWDNALPVIPAVTVERLLMLQAKRIVDLAMAVLLMIVFAPVFLLTAIAIKATSAGPVLFKQRRVGLNNTEFFVYKFRTMYTDQQDISGVRQTLEDDPRITPIGRFLRRTSVDEVPQIINILKGDMSFVGPRPHVAGMLAGGLPYEQLVPYYELRHAMKPGLTGWAQANGFRGPTIDPIRARQRVDHDIAYIQNFSLRLDMIIIVQTAWREFVTGTGV